MEIKSKILSVFNDPSEELFNDLALEIYRIQSVYNVPYRQYLSLIGRVDDQIEHYSEIPLMPIRFFKTHRIITGGEWVPKNYFLSSGTKEHNVRSTHYVRDISWYDVVSTKIFDYFLPQEYEIVALLPSYLENEHSSLVHMVRQLCQRNTTAKDPFFMYDFNGLHDLVANLLDNTDKSILIIGVTFALMDYVEKYPIDNPRVSILYTGGMKNRHKELTQEEVLSHLRKHSGNSKIFAEYGMTELLSQAYNLEESYYATGQTMRVISKDINDPLSNIDYGRTCQLGIIDLANINSLSFILTEDLAQVHSPREFQYMGRLQQSDLRGCNLIYDLS